jgi:ABC-type sugar transport system substrate-binding protein
MALGAIHALENNDIDPASIPIVGIDATGDAVNAILDGKMDMSVFQSAEGQAEAAVRIAKNLVDGKPVDEGTGCTVSDDCENIYYVPFEKVTADNAQDYAAGK